MAATSTTPLSLTVLLPLLLHPLPPLAPCQHQRLELRSQGFLLGQWVGRRMSLRAVEKEQEEETMMILFRDGECTN